MVLSRMAQDKLEGLPLQVGNPYEGGVIVGISRARLALMKEYQLLYRVPAIITINGTLEDEVDPKKEICRLLNRSGEYLAKAVRGDTCLGGEAWGILEKLMGVDAYDIWRNVKKGKP